MTDTHVDTTLLLTMFSTMLRIRRAEERIADLAEAEEIRCPCHLCIGQEAVATGVCAAIGPSDTVWGAHRSHGHYLAKGGDLAAMFAELYGKETGCARGRGGSMHLVAPEVGIFGTVPIVAATIPMAVGAALASALRQDGRVSMAFFGDGATEEGVFHEAMNLAASRQLATVFVCENNLYASHLELGERRAKDNIVQAADAHGMPGAVVDGNDVVAVYLAACEAVQRARYGGGPTLLECRTYRWRGHVGPGLDLDVGSRRQADLPQWRARDPIARVRAELLARGETSVDLDACVEAAEAAVEAAVAAARRAPYPPARDLERYVYRESTRSLS